MQKKSQLIQHLNKILLDLGLWNFQFYTGLQNDTIMTEGSKSANIPMHTF